MESSRYVRVKRVSKAERQGAGQPPRGRGSVSVNMRSSKGTPYSPVVQHTSSLLHQQPPVPSVIANMPSPSRAHNTQNPIPIPPTPSSPTYNTDANRISTASGYGTSAIGAMLTAPGGDSVYDSDSDSDSGDRYAYNTSTASDARSRLRKQVSKQNKAKNQPGAGLGERVMSPMSGYSEMDRDGIGHESRAISGVWGTAARIPSPSPTPDHSGTGMADLQSPDAAFAKGGDRRSVVTRQNVNVQHLRSIAGELDRDDVSVGRASEGKVSTGPRDAQLARYAQPTAGAQGGQAAPYFVPLAGGSSDDFTSDALEGSAQRIADKRRSVVMPASPAKGLSEEVRDDDNKREQESRVQGGAGIMKRQGEQGTDRYGGKRITIVDFPSPSFGKGVQASGTGGAYDARPSYEHGSMQNQGQGQYQYGHDAQQYGSDMGYQQHQQYDNYGNPIPAYPASTHAAPISSPHLHAMPAPSPSPSPSRSPLPSSTSLPALHIPSTTHNHLPTSSPSPSHAGGSFGQGSYTRLGSSSPNLGPSSGYQYQDHNGHLQRPGLITIDLPPPQSPISPMLAAPPSAHPGRMESPRHVNSATPSSMMSAGAVGSVQSQSPSMTGAPGASGIAGGPFQGSANRLSISSTNESIRGFDFLKEKNALFRGGEEDILGFNPRGPQKRQKPGRSGLGKNVAASRLMTTVDFWKRMSIMRVQGQGEKER